MIEHHFPPMGAEDEGLKRMPAPTGWRGGDLDYRRRVGIPDRAE